MIDEKKLIEYLKSEANTDRTRAYGEHECDLIEGTIRMCIDIVKAQPKVGEWIPCSERLPEEYIENLCCDIHGNFIVGFPTTNAVSNTGYAVETDNEIMYDCVAWMPLPEPYRGEEHGTDA